MKVVKNILIGLISLIGLFVVVGLFLPEDVRVERSIVVEAPPSTVFKLVNSFQRFNEWSPWAALDPDLEYIYEGPETGVGAKMSWSSEKPEVGAGSQEIIESKPDRMVKTFLDFGDQGTAIATFMLDPVDGGTRVTWGFDSAFGMKIHMRYFGLFFDSMIGPDYERGLSSLGALAEQTAGEGPVPDEGVATVRIEPVTIVYVTGTTTREPEDIRAAFAEAFAKTERFIEEQKLERAGPPRAVVNFVDESGYGFDAAMPVAAAGEAKASADVKIGPAYAGEAACTEHVGSYTELGATHEKIEAWMALNALQPAGHAWEEYLSDPRSTPEDALVTRVCYPVAPS